MSDLSETRDSVSIASRTRWMLWAILLIVTALVLARVSISLELTMSRLLVLAIGGAGLALAAHFFIQLLNLTYRRASIIVLVACCLTMSAAEHFFSWQRARNAERETFYEEIAKTKRLSAALAQGEVQAPNGVAFLEFMQSADNTQRLSWVAFALIEQAVAVGLFFMLAKTPARNPEMGNQTP